MGKIVGTSPSLISGSVGLYTYRQTKDAAVIDAWSGAEVLKKAAVSYGGYKAARFLEPGQTSANVAVERHQHDPFAQSVALQMASSSATTLVESETIKSHLFYATWRKEATIKFKQQLGDMAVKVKVKQNLNNDEFAKIMKLFSLNVDKGLDYAVDINHPQSGVWHMACNTSFADQDFGCGVLYADSGKAYTIRGRNYSTSKDVMFLRTRLFIPSSMATNVLSQWILKARAWPGLILRFPPNSRLCWPQHLPLCSCSNGSQLHKSKLVPIPAIVRI